MPFITLNGIKLCCIRLDNMNVKWLTVNEK